MARRPRRSQPEPDSGPESIPPSHVERLHRGEYSHIAEAAAAAGQHGLAANLCRELRPWAQDRVLSRRFA
jgi:hypothetical protein